VWNAVTSEYTSVGVIDDLFSLPSPVALLSLLCKYPKSRLLPLVTLTLLAQLLMLVGVLAPNALLIGANGARRSIPIPKLDLAAMPTNNDAMWWEDVAGHYITSDPVEGWNVPTECGTSCAFQILYSAPGLSCREMSEEETGLKPFNLQSFENGEEWLAYRSDSGGYQNTVWGTGYIPLNFSFVPMISQFSNNLLISVIQTGPLGGQLCEWRDRTFQADFIYKDNRRSITVKVISDTNDMAQDCFWTSGLNLSHECNLYVDAAESLAWAYDKCFDGRLGWDKSTLFDQWDRLLISQFIDYNYNEEAQTISLTSPSDLSQRVEQNFAKAVLGTLLRFNQTDSAFLTVEIGNAWLFYPLRLWVIYGPVLFLVLVAGLCGLHWAHQADVVREKKFSNFLAATRTKHLDTVCAQHSNVVMSTQLRHDAQTGRFLVLDDNKVDMTLPDTGENSRIQMLSSIDGSLE
jgi:hypothetical protein